MSQRLALALLIIGITAGCSAPFAVFPGGALEGDVRVAPSDWAFAGDFGTFQLETSPQEPYSVNIAYTILDGRLLVNAGDTQTQWVKNMTIDPAVRIRMDGAVYEMRATRVTDEARIVSFGSAWTDQSYFRRNPAELDEAWIYELTPR